MRPLARALFLLFALRSATGIANDIAAVERAERALGAGEPAAALVALPDPTTLSSDLRYRAAMVAGEAALAQREWARARSMFELAGHPGPACTGAAELGMIRAELQAGAFRAAKAMAGALAYDHPRASEAVAMHAFLDDRAGHVERARSLLREARRTRPGDEALLLAEAELLIDRGRADAAAANLDAQIILEDPSAEVYRMRARAASALGDVDGAARWRRDADRWRSPGATEPSAHGGAGGTGAVAGVHPAWRPYAEPIPVAAEVPVATASGLVVGDGTRVLTTAAIVTGEVLVRSALGMTRKARVERIDSERELAWLQLDQPLPAAWNPTAVVALRAGRPSLAIGYPLAGSTEPAWPAASAGINLRSVPGTGDRLHVTVAVGQGGIGAPVFDWQGRLVGIVTRPAADGATVVGASIPLRAPATADPGLGSGVGESASTLEEVYERALPAVVLVVSVRERVGK
jgi:hypothetical protein